MTFISLDFAVFIAVFLIIYKITENKLKLQNFIILVGNYIFYSLIDIKFAITLLLITIFTWIITKRMSINRSKGLMALGIAINVSTLAFFKYIGLFGDVAKVYGIIMPIGISFYVFEAISYIVDTYTGKMEEKTSLVDALIYLSFFPTVMSGPIVKAREFIPQIHRNRVVKFSNVERGMQRFVLGMFEKIVIADRLAISVDAVYSAPAAYNGASLFWNSISYTLQLFFDFAGYTNMAAGIAIVLGFSIGENFNLPYIAKSPSDFWKRWHISLSSWITEYIYIPLGGNRKGKTRTLVNIMLTMVISGIWHGSTVNFVVWGAGHGFAQIIQKLLEEKDLFNKFKNNNFGNVICIAITFLMVDLLWIPFRTADIATTLLVYYRIFTNASGLLYLYSYTAIFLVVLVAVEIYALVKNEGNNPIKALNLRTFKGKFLFVTLIIMMFMFAYIGDNAFIYGELF